VTGENQPSQISGQEPHKREHASILTDRNRLIQHTSLILMTDNHQGLGNRLLCPEPSHVGNTGAVQRRERLGGLLKYYYRAAA
jgi:hypothetical protein